jgi:hypothetical protein
VEGKHRQRCRFGCESKEISSSRHRVKWENTIRVDIILVSTLNRRRARRANL